MQEYNYGAVTSPCKNPNGTPTRETKTQYKSFASTPLFSTYGAILDRPDDVQVWGNGALLSETMYSYDQSAPTYVSAYNHDDANYGSGSTAPRGNATTVSKCTVISGNTCSSFGAATTYMYDTTGQVLSMTDPCGNASCADMAGSNHTTTYNYADNYTDGTPPGNTNAYVTTISEPSPNGPAMTTNFQWGYNDGKMWSKTVSNSPNNETTNYCYRTISITVTTVCPTSDQFDPFFRLTQIAYPDGGRQDIGYTDTAPTPIVQANVLQKSGTWMTTTTTYDAMGLPTQVKEPNAATVATTYDGLGRAWTVTNPYYSISDPTYGKTTYTYDALGRKTSQLQPDNGSTLQWCYNDIASQGQTNTCSSHIGSVTTGEWVDYTDEAGKHWQRTTDSLGRLNDVIEDASNSQLETDYTYDALNNLLSVTQKGGTTDSTKWRNRTFTYDSLSRLLTASNPESGTITYNYDANGNVSSKVSPLPNQTGTATLTTTNTYDELNRLTSVTFSDGITPGYAYWYDVPPSWDPGLQYVVGRVANSGNSYGGGTSGYATATAYSYDVMGRVLSQWEQTPSTSAGGYTVYSTYDVAGDMISAQTATGNSNLGSITFTYNYDPNGRLSSITSSLNDAQHPATLYSVDSSVGYYAMGPIHKATFGNGLTETQALNPRGQLCRMNVNSSSSYYSHCSDSSPSGTVVDFTTGYNAGTSDNGNVVSWSATGQQVFSRTYNYDNVNRISTMTETASGQACKGLSWTIDGWGNATAQNITSGSCFAGFNTTANTNNQLALYVYDSAGNVRNDGSHTYTYDALGRVLQVDSGNTASYVYNENGQRVRKNTSSGWTEYFYGIDGNVQTDFNGASFTNQYIYDGSKLLAIYTDNTTEFVHPDHLGSTRLVTGVSQNIIDNMDYYPFGQQSAGASATTHKFTSKELDSETNLYNFPARYYAANVARFMSSDWNSEPDPVPNAEIGDPQTLNLYAYVENSPVSAVDPDGHYCFGADGLECDTHGGAGSLMNYFVADLHAEGSAGTGEGVEQQTEDFWGQFDDKMGLSGNFMSQIPSRLGEQTGPFGAGINISPIIQNFTSPNSGGNVAYGAMGATVCIILEPCPEIVVTGVGIAGAGLGLWIAAKDVSEELGHKKPRPSTWDDHTKRRPGTSPPPNYRPFRKYEQPKNDKKKDRKKPYVRKDRD